MHSDDDQITLSKWPFYLGDFLLVATALTIALLRDWDLSTGQIAACVSAVGLGAALFTLPFIVEFQMRVRERREDRVSELDAVKRHLEKHESGFETAGSRIVELERQFTAITEATDLVAGAIETKVEQIEAFKDSQEAQLVTIRKAIEGLEATAGNEATDSEVKQAIEALAVKLAELARNEALGQLATRVELLENARSSETSFNEPMIAETASAEEAEANEEGSGEKSNTTRKPRKRTNPEPRLLDRAIKENQDSSSAVSRIITSKKRLEATEAAEMSISSEETLKPMGVEHVSSVENIEKDLEPEPVLVPEGVAIEPEPEIDMFADTVLQAPKSKGKANQSDTAVIASIFIGIGNKPFVRGTGGGLSLDEGIAMEFVEIGKWRWEPDEALDVPIDVQILRNDEDPDENGMITLDPGQKLDISPKFQASEGT